MEFTIQQSDDLIKFIDNNGGIDSLVDYNSIIKSIQSNTMKETAFDLNGEQTDDIKEVYAYMMRNSLTKLDSLKSLGKLSKKQ